MGTFIEILPATERKQSAVTQDRAGGRELLGILGGSPGVKETVPAREAPCSSPCFRDREAVGHKTGSTHEHKGVKLKIIAA